MRIRQWTGEGWESHLPAAGVYEPNETGEAFRVKLPRTQASEPGDTFWTRQQVQRGPRPWLIAQSVIFIASAGFFGDPLIPLAWEKSSHVPPARVSAGPR